LQLHSILYDFWSCSSIIKQLLLFQFCSLVSLLLKIVSITTTPWTEYTRELYRPSDRRLSVKLVPTIAVRVRRVVMKIVYKSFMIGSVSGQPKCHSFFPTKGHYRYMRPIYNLSILAITVSSITLTANPRENMQHLATNTLLLDQIYDASV
jgi:hypothetical protein